MKSQIIALCLVVGVYSSHVQVCTNNQQFEISRQLASAIHRQRRQSEYNPLGTGFITGGTDYEIACCGFLNSYEVRVDAAGDLTFQLWRANGTGYQLIYQNTSAVTTNAGGRQTINLDTTVAVFAGDKWGWWTSGAALVKFDSGSTCAGDATCTTDTKTLGALSLDHLEDWSTGTTAQANQYAISLSVDGNDGPSFTNLNGVATIDGNASIGFSVFNVTTTDPDTPDLTDLSVTMATNTYFSFDNTTGEVTVSSDVGNAPSPTTLSFTVTDPCHNEQTRTLDVTITNVPPVINLLPNSTSISELIEDPSTLYTFNYSDPGDTVTCTLTSPAGAPFTLEQNGTELVLYSDSNPGFDFGTTPAYVLEITCDDTKDPSVGYFTVNITENLAPTHNNLGNFTEMSEDVTTEELLYTLDVTDPEGLDFTCSLNSGASSPTDSSTYFSVRLKTATSVWAIYSRPNVVFSYRTVHTYRLKIDCADSKDTSQGTFTVYLLANKSPYFTNLPNSVILSSTAAVGHTIFTLSYNDLEGDTGTYSISCDPTGCPFTLLQSGAIQLNTVIPASTSIPGYDVTATVSDAKSTSVAKILTVLITGINAAPSISNLATTFAIAENSAFSTSVVTTICQDSNAGDTLVYSMTCSSSGLTYFTISSTGGTITTSSTVNINYETIAAAGSAVFACSVTCSDGQVSDTKSVDLEIVDVNEAPYFGQSAYSITANEGTAGTVISSTGFTVSDDDTGDSATFKLDCGTSSKFFSIDKTSGVVSYSSDYDVDDGARPTSIACTVKATDVYGLTATASVQINIDNINDNSPVFASGSYTFFSDVSASLNTVLGTVTASDADSGTYGTITYTLNSLPHDEDFFGVSQSAEIYIKTSLAGLGEGAVVTFSVLATDGGGLTDTCFVTIVTHTTSVSSVYVDTTRYRTFFEDPKNIPWFMACILTLLAIIGFSGWLILTKQTIPCPYSMKCCKIGKEYDTADRGDRVRRFSHQDIRNDVYAFE